MSKEHTTMALADLREVGIISGLCGAFFGVAGWACYGWHYAWRCGLAAFIVFAIFMIGVGVTGEQ